jgi:hypothetical protein
LASFKKSVLLLLLQTLLAATTGYAQVAGPQGPRIRVTVNSSGVYKIDYDMLRKAGLDPDAIDPRRLHLYGFPSGMLPQSNDPAVQWKLEDLSIRVIGEEDGKFDKQDAIIFYAQGPDRIEYNEQKSLFNYENNLYSDINSYLVSVEATGGPRIATAAAVSNAVNSVSEFVHFDFYERDLYNDLKSGRHWFGEIMDSKPELTIRFNVDGIVANSDIRIVSSLMAQSYSPSSFRMSWNNVQVLDRPMDAIPQTQYGLKGYVGVDTIDVNATAVNASASATQDIKITFTKGGTDRSVGFLDFVLLNIRRKLSWYGNAMLYTIPAQNDIVSTINITNAPPDAHVWDVTNPLNAQEILATTAGSTASFGAATETTRTYFVFQDGQIKSPVSVEQTTTSNPASIEVPDFLIITNPLFEQQANRLAAHRRSTYGLDVAVVRTDAIYDFYAGGRQDISAIRNFIRELYQVGPDKFRNVLLFGRGSYDYKDRVVNNSNYIPTYESRNSLSPLETWSSDDFFVLLENNEGIWSESPAANSTLDLGIGRIPARTTEEAAVVVDKLIAYDKDKDRFAGWKKDILFVADDGDWNIHQGDADELAEDIEDNYHKFHTNKIYVDAFQQENIASGQKSTEATAALERELNKGYAIVNYTGHGNEFVWMDERILDQDTPFGLTNSPRLPLYITATCEFGRHDNPSMISTAELLLTRKKGGAIGLVTTARPVHSTTNFFLNKAFYASLFDPDENGKDLGTLFRETKNNSLSGISNRNFSLLGDPSMRFGLHPEELVATRVETIEGSSILSPLSEVIVEGEVRRGSVLVDFDGVVEITLHDKRGNFVTRGDENEPFDFKNWDHSLFRGKGSIEDGRFVVVFRLPANLDQAISEGKLSMYAYNYERSIEALGTELNISLGGAPVVPEQDSKGPLVDIFVGDTTFVNGGYANNNTTLLAKLSDKSGLNISGYEPYGLTAQLDDGPTFSVDDYYVASVDDATQGKVSYPLNGLAAGEHRLTFTAYDNYNNKTTSILDFTVGEQGQLVVEDFMGYPNPFSEADPATFKFTHNRTSEDLEAELLIFNSMGQLTEHLTYFVPSSGYTVTLGTWNGLSSFGTKMSTGIYLAKLSVRSLTDGAKNLKIAKLILVN